MYMKMFLWLTILIVLSVKVFGQEDRPVMHLTPLVLNERGDLAAKIYNNDHYLEGPGVACIKIVLQDAPGQEWDSKLLKVIMGGFKEVKDTLGQVWVYVYQGAKEGKINYPGYEELKFECGRTLEKDQVYHATLSWKYNYGSLNINTNVDSVEIRLNGVLREGLAPLILDSVRTGKYTVNLQKRGFIPYTDTVWIKDNKMLELSVEMREDKKYGSVYLVTDPSGADVTIDNVWMEKLTPCSIDSVRIGKRQIVLSKEGYESVVINCDVKENGKQKLGVAKLKRIEHFGEVVITCLDDESKKEIPAPLLLLNGNEKIASKCKLKIGKNKITISADGYNKQNQEITVEEDKVKELTFLLEKVKDYGSLQVNTSPTGADIKLNNELQETQTPGLIRYPVGEYQLILNKYGYKPVVKNVRIRANGITTVNEKMASVYASKYTRHFWFEYTYSPTTFAGVTIGAGRRLGGYIRARGFAFDFGKGKNYQSLAGYAGAVDRSSLDKDGYLRDAYTAGLDFGATRWLYVYAGAGYGGYCVVWEDSVGKKYTSAHLKGTEIEVGVRFKFGCFQLSLGADVLAGKTEVNDDMLCEYNAGIGFCF